MRLSLKSTLSIILSTSLTLGIAQTDVDDPVGGMVERIQANSQLWENDSPEAQRISQEALRLLERYPAHPKASYLLRYHLKAASFKAANDTLLHYMDSIYHRCDSLLVVRDWFYYNNAAGSLTTLSHVYSRVGDYAAVSRYNNLVELVTKAALRLTKEGSKEQNISLYKLLSFYNNKGIVLYRTTHHLDPQDKKNEIGPIIESSWLKADSLARILRTQQYDDIECEPSHLINMVLLYGHYYKNETKADLYGHEAEEFIRNCNDDNWSSYMAFSAAHLATVRSWNNYANSKFVEVTREGYKLLAQVENVYRNDPSQASFLFQDVLYMLSSSFYHQGAYDSAAVYGARMLSESEHFKDYAHLAEVASYMTELTLTTDPKKAMEYLVLSKEYMSKAQHEAAQTQIVKAGEEIALRKVFEQVNHLSIRLEDIHQRRQFQIMLIWVSVILTGVLGLLFFLYKLHHTGFFMKARSFYES